MLFLAACGKGKLSQDNAEKVIRTFIPAHKATSYEEVETCFNVQSIATVEPLSQFSETEASTVVTFKCARPLAFKFLFQKDVDGRWFLMNLGVVKATCGDACGWEHGLVQSNANLKVLAQ